MHADREEGGREGECVGWGEGITVSGYLYLGHQSSVGRGSNRNIQVTNGNVSVEVQAYSVY